jgi:hypothetical protein
MILNNKTKAMSGFEVVIEAALKSGSQSYFACPSPFQSLILNEGAQRFVEQHGTFIQAESPAAAVAMAIGASAVGAVPLISVNEQDFLQLQESLAYACIQSWPMVLVIVANGLPGLQRNWLSFQTLNYYFEPNLASGSALLTFLPSSLQSLWIQMGQAFQASLNLSQPVLLVLDPILLMQQDTLNLASVPILKHHTQEKNEPSLPTPINLELAQSWSHLGAKTELIWLTAGVLAEWVDGLNVQEWGVFCPQTLFPFPAHTFKNLFSEHPQAQYYVLEYDSTALFQKIQSKFPEIPFSSLTLAGPAEPLGLEKLLRAGIHP